MNTDRGTLRPFRDLARVDTIPFFDREWVTLFSARGLLVCTVAFAALAAGTTQAARAQLPEVTRCMDAVDMGAFKNSQMNACYEQELARQDKVLNAEYRRMQAAVAGPEAGKALVLGQRAWLAFRTSWCDFEARQMSAPNPEFNRLACMVNLTAAQSKLLHDDAS